MWEEFGLSKAKSYSNYKFNPNHRVGLTNHLREKLIYKFVDVRKSDILLDVGCASGFHLFKLAKQVAEGYGVDIAREFINQANKEKERLDVDNIYFVESNLEKLPYLDNNFDKIICAEVLEHVIEEDLSILEIKRVLKKDGTLVITVPNMNADATIWGRFMRFLGFRRFVPLKEFSEEAINKHGDAHVREFNKSSLIDWVTRNGFKVLDIKSVSFVDGPYFDKLIKIPLHISFLQKLIIKLEMFLSWSNLFFGRHLIIKLTK